MTPESRPLAVLTYSTLFPNALQPRHGIFVQQRLAQLRAEIPVHSRVVAPVPWFPSRAARFGQYAVYAGVPRAEMLDDVPVWHPRYVVVPRLSWPLAPWLLYRATLATLARLHAETPIDVLDAHFFYPDGVAAVLLGRALGIPVCITARGSDLTLMPDFALPRRWIRWAASHAEQMITVSAALRGRLLELGAPADKVTVLRNGVDLERFHEVPRAAARAALDVQGPLLLAVGNLVELKGHHLMIEALPELPECTLLIIGEGPERAALERLAQRLGVAHRVRLLGLIAQTELRQYYSAADLLLLASSREGWPNVLLEAMACGTPVLSTRVWGTPEVVTAAAAGALIEERSAAAIVAGVRRLLAAPPARADTRRYAEGFNWSATSHGQIDVFRRAIAARRGAAKTG